MLKITNIFNIYPPYCRKTKMIIAVLLWCALASCVVVNWTTSSLPQERRRSHGTGGTQQNNNDQDDLNNVMLPLQINKAPSKAETAYGYVVVESFGRATVRHHLSDYLALQWWAGKNKLKIVTLWVVRSALITPLKNWLPNGKRRDLLPLRTFYDVDTWTKQAVTKGAAQMSELTEFFSSAPRNVIVAHLNKTCHDFTSQSWTADYTEMKRKGFIITKELCIASTVEPLVLLNNLSNILKTSPYPITLLLNEWWLSIKKLPHAHSCRKYSKDLTIIPPSKGVMEDASKYIKRYLDGKRHIAVVVGEPATRSKNFPACLERTLTFLHTMRGKNKNSIPFIAVQDQGVDSSINFRTFFKAVYHRTLTLEEWKMQIRTASTIDNKDYRALIQQVVSWRGTCLLVAGEGDYEQYMIQQYVASRQDISCLVTIRHCLV